ncbi:MAG: ABC transporter permease [Clostridia bacterium]|nr:ABC transporter permease [Clostridia bacterium]
MFKYLICALRNLSRKKFRSVLTICGIAIGVTSVIIINAIGMGGREVVAAQLDGLGLNGLNIHTKSDSVITSTSSMVNEDLHVCSSVAGVEAAMPIIMQFGSSIMRGETDNVLVWGIGSNASKIISLSVLHGRMFTQSDVVSHAMVCLVDESFAKSTYKRSNITGTSITVYLGNGYQQLRVEGVVEQGSSLLSNLAGSYMPNFIYVPYTTVEDLKGKKGYDQIAVRMAPNYSLDTAGKRITALLAKLHGSDNYQADNMLKQKQRMDNMLSIITLIISAIGAISLIVAGLSIMTVMTVSVNERTKEIGIKKAIGAKKGVILLEFLYEALFISLFGAAAGVAAAALCTLVASKLLNFSLSLTATGVFSAAGFAALIGITFGVYPAIKASRLRPVDALRRE